MPHYDKHGQVMNPIKFMLPEEQARWTRAKELSEEIAPGWFEKLDHEDRCILMDVLYLAINSGD